MWVVCVLFLFCLFEDFASVYKILSLPVYSILLLLLKYPESFRPSEWKSYGQHNAWLLIPWGRSAGSYKLTEGCPLGARRMSPFLVRSRVATGWWYIRTLGLLPWYWRKSQWWHSVEIIYASPKLSCELLFSPFTCQIMFKKTQL
jgi:hypothetical protein